jgi:hypothetical protein
MYGTTSIKFPEYKSQTMPLSPDFPQCFLGDKYLYIRILFRRNSYWIIAVTAENSKAFRK